jgi:hypothetical protein
MGTNYYAEFPVCEHCGRGPERLHICKSMVTFEAHQAEEGLHPELTSWRAYRAWLREGGVQVRDEYGVTHDVETFIAKVELTAEEDRRRQHDWVVANEPSLLDRYWLDADDFTFSWGEFT